jgi:3-oxoacyl-[acyl-carrier-protein] synthase-3
MAIGSSLGAVRVDNKAVAAGFGKDASFVAERIGALELRRAAPIETAVSLAAAACRDAVRNTNLSLKDVGLVLFVTQNPDHGGLPHNSAMLQAELDLPNSAVCLDIGLGCSGFAYGLAVASSMMKTLGLQTALLVTSDQYGRHLRADDSNTQMLFSDGACATMLSTREGALEIKACRLGTDGRSHDALIRDDDNVIRMNGRAVFGFSRKVIPNEIRAFVEELGVALETFDALLLHQGSRAIVEEIRKELNLDQNKVPVEIEGYGNLVSSSLPMLLKPRLENRSLSRIILAGFGVGLSWGAVYLERRVYHV